MPSTASKPACDPAALRGALDALYERWNRLEHVSPDPLQFLHAYNDPADREVVGIVASSLAYGRVAQILRSVSGVLSALSPRPARFLGGVTPRRLAGLFSGFRHRFTTGDELSSLLLRVKEAREREGSLEALFCRGLPDGAETVLPALGPFSAALSGGFCPGSMFLPDAGKGSACKRLNLYLRWMARRDAVDPGGWERVSPRRLIVPLDVHMHRLSRALGLTRRAAADMRTALEVTAAFRAVSPGDPARYDFALTRLGILSDPGLSGFLAACGAPRQTLHKAR